MEEEVYTYPISSLNRYVKEELIFYDAYRKFHEIMGGKIRINVIISSQDIGNFLENVRILNPEKFTESLINLLQELHREGKLKIEKKTKCFCEKCGKYYSYSEIEWDEDKIRQYIVKVRIGRKLYFVDILDEGETPLGIAINKRENLIAIRLEEEIWISPLRLKNVLIQELEVPEKIIELWESQELLKEEYHLQEYVIMDEQPTGFITNKNREKFSFTSVIPSYTTIYSLERKIRVPKCPVCHHLLKKVEVPYVTIGDGDSRLYLSSEEGEYRMPILYCEQCGYAEIGEKIKECPKCGNIMSMPFFLNSDFLSIGVYLKKIKKAGVGFLHQNRYGVYYFFSSLTKALNKTFFEKTIFLRHEPPEDIDEDSRAVLLSKKRGEVREEDLKKIRKLKNILINIWNYTKIYGAAEAMDTLDQWLLNENEKVKREYILLISEYKFAEAFQLLYRYVINDISHFYIPMKRPFPILKKPLIDVFIMLYPYLPIFSRDYLTKMSVRELRLEANEHPEEINIDIAREIVRVIRRYRKENNIPKREPIKKVFFVSDHADEAAYFTSGIMKMENILLFNPTERWEEMEVEIVPNLEAISATYRALASKIAFLLRRKNVKEIMDAMNKGGYSLGVEGFIIKITPNMLRYIEKMPKGYVKMDTRYGPIYILKERDISTERLRFVNEIVRRINYMRKDLDLDYDDIIDVSISGDKDIIREVRVYAEDIRGRCRIRNLDFEYRDYAYVVVWPILDHEITISINPLFKKWVIKAFKSIPGIAESKAEALFHMGYGSVYELMQAPPSEIAEIPGFSLSLANKIREYLYSHAFRTKKVGRKTLCPFCDTELSEEDVFCPRCGAPIRIKLEETKEIKEGHIYLFMGSFQRLLSHVPSHLRNERKLLVTKENPETARKIYSLKNIQIIWISYVPLGRSIKPKELEKLKDEIIKMINRGVKIVLMDCFDLLLAINDVENVRNFLRDLRDKIKSTSSLLLFNVEDIEEETLEKLLSCVDAQI